MSDEYFEELTESIFTNDEDDNKDLSSSTSIKITAEKKEERVKPKQGDALYLFFFNIGRKDLIQQLECSLDGTVQPKPLEATLLFSNRQWFLTSEVMVNRNARKCKTLNFRNLVREPLKNYYEFIHTFTVVDEERGLSQVFGFTVSALWKRCLGYVPYMQRSFVDAVNQYSVDGVKGNDFFNNPKSEIVGWNLPLFEHLFFDEVLNTPYRRKATEGAKKNQNGKRSYTSGVNSSVSTRDSIFNAFCTGDVSNNEKEPSIDYTCDVFQTKYESTRPWLMSLTAVSTFTNTNTKKSESANLVDEKELLMLLDPVKGLIFLRHNYVETTCTLDLSMVPYCLKGIVDRSKNLWNREVALIKTQAKPATAKNDLKTILPVITRQLINNIFSTVFGSLNNFNPLFEYFYMSQYGSGTGFGTQIKLSNIIPYGYKYWPRLDWMTLITAYITKVFPNLQGKCMYASGTVQNSYTRFCQMFGTSEDVLQQAETAREDYLRVRSTSPDTDKLKHPLAWMVSMPQSTLDSDVKAGDVKFNRAVNHADFVRTCCRYMYVCLIHGCRSDEAVAIAKQYTATRGFCAYEPVVQLLQRDRDTQSLNRIDMFTKPFVKRNMQDKLNANGVWTLEMTGDSVNKYQLASYFETVCCLLTAGTEPVQQYFAKEFLDNSVCKPGPESIALIIRELWAVDEHPLLQDFLMRRQQYLRNMCADMDLAMLNDPDQEIDLMSMVFFYALQAALCNLPKTPSTLNVDNLLSGDDRLPLDMKNRKKLQISATMLKNIYLVLRTLSYMEIQQTVVGDNLSCDRVDRTWNVPGPLSIAYISLSGKGEVMKIVDDALAKPSAQLKVTKIVRNGDKVTTFTPLPVIAPSTGVKRQPLLETPTTQKKKSTPTRREKNPFIDDQAVEDDIEELPVGKSNRSRARQSKSVKSKATIGGNNSSGYSTDETEFDEEARQQKLLDDEMIDDKSVVVEDSSFYTSLDNKRKPLSRVIRDDSDDDDDDEDKRLVEETNKALQSLQESIENASASPDQPVEKRRRIVM